MIGRLRGYLKQRRKLRRQHRKRWELFERWLAAHPGGCYGEFLAEETRSRINAGESHYTLGLTSVDQAQVKARAQTILGSFRAAGGNPRHVVVDYGCGSLWVGEAFMDYLDPGNYIGLDVSDTFYAEGLTRLSPEFIASRMPVLRVITDQVLREVRDRMPDFIMSFAVMHHVPPEELAGFLKRIVSLAHPRSRIEIAHAVGFRTRWVALRRCRHGRYAVRSALASLGYKADYRPESRIFTSTPGFSVVRR